MMRSLYSGVSGLKNHQTRMDVIGNNIANVNTIGFKKSTVQFKDQLSQTLSPASGPSNATGGANAKQVGLGVTLGAIGTQHTQGNIQYTGGTFHMAISGDGYFTVKSADGQTFYTRAGDFELNPKGELIDAAGNYVQVIPSDFVPGDPTATPPVLPSFQPRPGATPDSLADPGRIQIPKELFSGVGVNEAGGIVGVLDKVLEQPDIDALAAMGIDTAGMVAGTPADPTTNPPTAEVPSVPPSGSTITMGYVAVAQFSNPGGLEKAGNNLYRSSANSGEGLIGVAGGKGRGTIAPTSLEMANVDLSEEMVNMIVTQRGFQANSRIITTSDAMLEELVNLKR